MSPLNRALLISRCRFVVLRNVPRYKMRVRSIAIHIFSCSFNIFFGDVLDRWCLIFVVVWLKPPLNFLRTMLVLHCCIRLFCFHSLMINIIHRNLCSALLNHLLKTQVLGNNEETLVSLFGVYFAMKKTKRKRRLISSVSRESQLLYLGVLGRLVNTQ